MDGENDFHKHNPCPALDAVWESYNKCSNAGLQKLLQEIPTSLPPKASANRQTMIKTMLALRAIGVLHEPTYRFNAQYGTTIIRQ